MNSSVTQYLPLDDQIREAHETLGGLERRLRAIDQELEALADQREQYELLDQAVGSLRKLDELGVADLFWGEQAETGKSKERMEALRVRIERFHEQIAEIEDRRRALLDEIKSGQEVLDILEDDLDQQREIEEERQREWLIEREIRDFYTPAQVMPWMRGGEDDARFRRSLLATMLLGLLIGMLIPMIELPIPERAELIEVPERLARLIREEPVPIPTPQVEPEPEVLEEEVPEPEDEPEPEPLLAEETPPTETVEPDVSPPPAPEPQPSAEERIRSTGILAFRESFSDLAANRPSARLGSAASISTAGETAIGRTERSMVTTNGPGSSGGINLASISRDVGGGGGGGSGGDIAGVAVSRVASAIGGTGTGDRPMSGGGGAAAGRTDEEIQIVFDRYKSALYRLYNRELRNNPALRGQVILRLTIEPDGSVSLCELQSTDMAAPALIDQVVERVRTFDFGAKEGVPAITISYPIDFLPAG